MQSRGRKEYVRDAEIVFATLSMQASGHSNTGTDIAKELFGDATFAPQLGDDVSKAVDELRRLRAARAGASAAACAADRDASVQLQAGAGGSGYRSRP